MSPLPSSRRRGHQARSLIISCVRRWGQSMTEFKQKLTLDRLAVYRIQVPGHLSESWPEWAGSMTITVEGEGADPSITTLTGTFDQAALQSLLRRLYSLGSPLISVVCMDCG